jgi:S1-C subfamily serine protease
VEQVEEARMTTATRERQAAASVRPGRSRGLRRARAAGAAALLVGTVACSAAPALGAPMLVRAGGPAGGYGGAGSTYDAYGGYAGYGGYATPVSQPATAEQSAGVVLIDTVLPYQNAQAAGTGMVLTAAGQVLTNYHVVEGAGTITVTVATTGRSYPATVVGSDPSNDVALLQLTGASGLTTVTADDDVAKVGDAVTAVGNAGGTGSLTSAAGTISSLTASVTAASEGSTGSETLSAMVETTADVVSGDSGGPLFDAEGEVVGIDTAASTGSQIDGYAIPIKRALAIVDQIQSGTETGTVRIGPAAFLGVELSGGPSLYGYGYGYARNATSGAVVGNVIPGGAAAAAGLQAGDVITSLSGRSIASVSDIGAALTGANAGDQVTIGWTDQSGVSHTATVALGASPVA